ncbi:MAG TPA: sugar ABC transporter ATP-binding protein [Dongiaceae bacterium]|jgi:ribose transport system ATP-binding protein|nr:sugar ABC transporter ATP-binding protein [Dongiaceae bacterium]
MNDLLGIQELTKRFLGTLALDRVNFSLKAGEVHALLGQNGAGKSTLIKILAGLYPTDGGRIHFSGHSADPTERPLPISFIHQDLGLIDGMSVAENVALGMGYPRKRGLIDWKAARARAAAVLTTVGCTAHPDARVKDLSAADRSLLAIGRALAVRHPILILDEPTAALPAADVDRLLAALAKLRAEGLGILYVTHRLDEVFRIADRVTVLRDGRVVTTSPLAETTPAKLVDDIVGASLAGAFRQPNAPLARPLFALRAAVTGDIAPVSFDVAQGETVALVGLRGAGHHEIGRAIFATPPFVDGEVILGDEEIFPSDPHEAMALGIGFVSSKRGEESLAMSMRVRENLFLNQTLYATRGGRANSWHPLSRAEEGRRARLTLDRFSVRPRDPERAVATLSGGNQQKVVVARWLEAGVKLLVLEEPTIGVDVGAKAEIYRHLRQALRAGLGVLLVSSDFEEVERIAHRALVFNRGRMVAEVKSQDLTVARLTALAAQAVAA